MGAQGFRMEQREDQAHERHDRAIAELARPEEGPRVTGADGHLPPDGALHAGRPGDGLRQAGQPAQ